ncbi:putative ABC transport system permease protein [Clostridium cavendishii DSM 21758]|uniref:Putative ABC transport system permease protein n=1 Tax=Clostridium cavendishii DSM 21758 TaxID=1121302 RepID=A0A1M6J425_9CLOT|nr:FtsX-like permease family protein [Clostridium cavendishii]SHJ41470.1 putative ABC transport system permease protein [Clostridium cavendishii DSM 21758]
MISSYKTLSSRYLKKNKKRTILTMIGIILSVALISCIGMFISTIRHSMIEDTKNIYGDYHVAIVNARKYNIDNIKDKSMIDSYGLLDKPEEGVPFIKDKEIKVIKSDNESFKILMSKLLEGNFPTKDDEIAIEKWVLKFLEKPVKIGDEISVTDKDNTTKKYRLSGILENRRDAQVSGCANAYTYISNPSEKSKILIKLKDSADIKKFIKDARDSYGKENIQTNNHLLVLTGGLDKDDINNAISIVAGIIIGIVVIATIFVIYNAFNISIADRMTQFGLLRAIGTTKKQMRSLVFREASVMSIISVPIGLVCGALALYIVAFIFSKMPGTDGFNRLQVIIEPKVIIISTVVSLATIYISAFLPARAAGKISPLLAISNSTLINKEKGKKGKKWLSKVFKIHKVMAIKNVKRSKKRFYLSTISMAISVILFVTFSSFMDFTKNFRGADNEDTKVNFEIYGEKGINENVIKEVNNIDEVSKVYTAYTPIIKSKALVKDSDIPEIVKNTNKKFENAKLNNEDKKLVDLDIDFYNKDKMSASKAYVKQGSIDNLGENEVIIIRDTFFIDKKGKVINSPISKLGVGDEIVVDSSSINIPKVGNPENANKNIEGEKKVNKKDNFKDSDVIKLKVKAIMDVTPFENFLGFDDMKVISRLEDKDKILKANKDNKDDIYVDKLSIILKDKTSESTVDTKLKAIEEQNSGIRYTNKIAESKNRESANLQMQILLMGFITVISLISSVNIVNTVSTNIILRRRELAGLKAIGMTDKEVKNMITLEGMLFGVYGGVIGSIIGTILSYLLYKAMTVMIGFSYTFPIKYIIISLVAVMLIGYISALIPLGRLKKDSIIDAIREN